MINIFNRGYYSLMKHQLNILKLTRQAIKYFMRKFHNFPLKKEGMSVARNSCKYHGQ